MKRSYKLCLRLLALALCCGLIVSVTTGCCFCLPSSVTEKFMKKNDTAPVTQAPDNLATRDEQDTLATDPSEEVEATTTTTQLPIIQTTQPTGPIPDLGLQNMYVVADGGLRMREQPNTDADTILTIPNMTKVKVLAKEGDWSYVQYKNKEGWCSSDWLFHTFAEGVDDHIYKFEQSLHNPSEIPSDGIWSDATIQQGLKDANAIIESYAGEAVVGSLTQSSLTVEEVLSLYDAAHYLDLISRTASWANRVTPAYGGAVYFSGSAYNRLAWQEGTLVGYNNFNNLCEKFFACLSDRLAYTMLANDIAIIDGQVYGGYRPITDMANDLPYRTACRVEQDGNTYRIVVNEWYYEDNDNPKTLIHTTTTVYTCAREDGAWVITEM